jgi:hypothetical protein
MKSVLVEYVKDQNAKRVSGWYKGFIRKQKISLVKGYLGLK